MQNDPTPPPEGHTRPADHAEEVDAFREQQAIAAAMMIGEKMRRDDRRYLHWYALRLGYGAIALAALGLVMLFAFAQFKHGDDFNPTLPMLALGLLAGTGAVAAYWGHTESRREDD